jgi:uncharacterized phage-associated protein
MVNEATFKALVLAIANHPAVQQLGRTKLWKLIYFIDAAMLRQCGQTITHSDYIRYEHGPVPRRGEKIIKAMNKQGAISVNQMIYAGHEMAMVSAVGEGPKGHFSREASAVIDRICRSMGGHTAKFLSELSHQEPAWLNAGHLDKLDPVLIAYGSSEDSEGL